MEELGIGTKRIGGNSPCFIIAEAGVNHNGDLGQAKKLVDAATSCGADAVKFQSFIAEELAVTELDKAEYQENENAESQFEMLKKLELNKDEFGEIHKHCQEKGIIFLSTPFDFKSADMLEQLGVAAYKIASGDLNNYPFLSFVAKKGKPMIVSTGMASWEEIKEAVDAVLGEGNNQLALLQCTTGYPAKFEDINLNAMISMRKHFGLVTGFSDHTLGIEASVAAAALGAKIIEKHFTLDKTLPGPDHKASLSPEELKLLVVSIRNVEAALGSPEKIASESEAQILEVVRKKIVASKDIQEGTEITKELLCFKRAKGGLAPFRAKELIGKKAIKTIKKDQTIMLEDVGG